MNQRNKQLLKTIRRLLLANRFYGYSGFCLSRFVERAAREIPAGSRLLDVGAGECQYKSLFKHVKYTAQDLCIGDEKWDFSQIDVVSEVYAMPLPENSFDNLLCIEVLEHLKYPAKALAEMGRVLRPGGRLYVVCPFFWGEHQIPHDYFRYTQFALKSLAEDNGFAVEYLAPHGGRYVFLGSLLNDFFPGLLTNRILRLAARTLLYPINFLTGLVLYFLDKLDKEKDITLQYECIFVKKQ